MTHASPICSPQIGDPASRQHYLSFKSWRINSVDPAQTPTSTSEIQSLTRTSYHIVIYERIRTFFLYLDESIRQGNFVSEFQHQTTRTHGCALRIFCLLRLKTGKNYLTFPDPV
ncbi:hypothetical protein EVAR_25832_1 [Eumeta japonica]|uniref:Uncharacterized protein n=1 Tax=Eumeta variegata TaxID=151549 RepID=A0A4C1VWK1_EUMVA|nr:hypothetical protein EVAR_25832_1 [Eumeta japonica]